MRLGPLTAVLGPAEVTGPAAHVDVTAIDYDSRSVAPGSLFCCLVGQRGDGHDFVAEAESRGAVALVVERPLSSDLPQVLVPDARAAMGRLAAKLEGDPSQQLRVVGITGTNGKTTTAHVIDGIATAVGHRSAVIGTLTGVRTTPESPDLQRRLAELVRDEVDLVAMEVSSHALALHRVDGCRFRVAVFTSLGIDHLDFHETVEEYYRAKRRLFTPELADRAVVNVDDPYGRRLAEETPLEVSPVTLDALGDLRVGLRSNEFVWRGRSVSCALGGSFNARNALVAAETCVVLGLDEDQIAAGLGAVRPVPGRFETVGGPGGPVVLVDYAHTPDGLEALLTSARELTPGRLWVVFGCGGDRDRSKRPLMGAAAAQLADKLVVTSDNPRSEEPMAIIRDVEAGIEAGVEPRVELDRRRAIEWAVLGAADGDVVVIAGKGHETSQIIGTETIPFDDRAVAAEVLDQRGASTP